MPNKPSFSSNQRGSVPILLLLAALGLLVFILISNTASFKDKLFNALFPKPPSHAVSIRGEAGDLWADIIIGQPDFSEITPHRATDHNLFNPHGVIVDRASTPNVLYVFDGGHNRIFGYKLGPGFCDIQSSGNPLNCRADIVLGQPNMNTAACNGDSGFQNHPQRAPASASTICGEKEDQLSISEGGNGSSMAVDSSGNLFLVDFWNHRVLKYNSPMTSDTIADEVWGQDNFSGNLCNKELVQPDATTLCFWNGYSNNWIAGVEIDASGNVWVGDSGNYRILRFPPGSKTADLVLGQSDFAGRIAGAGLNQVGDISAVRMLDGKLYAADRSNNRVLVYDSPFTNGMKARVLPGDYREPSGVDTDPTEPGKLWIADFRHEALKLVDPTITSGDNLVRQIFKSGGFLLKDVMGSIGVDSAGNIFTISGLADNLNHGDITVFAKGGPPDQYSKRFYGRWQDDIDLRELGAGLGVVVSDGQLIVSESKLFFWNMPNGVSDLSSGKAADGFAGVTALTDLIPGNVWLIRADKQHHLYALTGPSKIDIYQLPLVQGALPIKTINSSLPLLGGGTTELGGLLFGIAPSEDGNFLWISDQGGNRVYRIRNPLTNPVVDIILGQTSGQRGSCNRGGTIAADTLCEPGSVSLDKLGNLFVSDHSLEANGNHRLLIFNKELIPNDNTSVMYAPAASKILPGIASWQAAFDSQNKMVVGFNPYIQYRDFGNAGIREHSGGHFPGVYLSPLTTDGTPNDYIKDFASMAFAATFDNQDNLYIADLNRARVLIYKNPFNNPVPSPTPTPTPAPTPTPLPTSTPTPVPSPTPTSTPTSNTVVISNISSTTTAATATIKWTTNVPATSRVEYGLTANLGSSTTENTSLVTNHSVTISGLIKQTRYYYKVISKNSAGLETSSTTQQFRTKNK